MHRACHSATVADACSQRAFYLSGIHPCSHHNQDLHKSCSVWAKRGECTANPNYMLGTCALSCEPFVGKEGTRPRSEL